MLTERIEGIRALWNVVGLSVAVVRYDELIYAQGFGARDHRNPVPVDADTLFQVGSIAKAFASASLGLLVEEGRVRWDDPVVAHLPQFRLSDPGLTQNVSIRDLLAHRTGISHGYYPYLGLLSLDEAIAELRHLTPQGRFRDSFVYSNLMYAAAGKIAEMKSGKTWHEFMRERLLRPLGMHRSGTSPYEYWDARHVAPTYLGTSPGGVPRLDQARCANVALPHALNEQGAITALPWQSYDNSAAAGAVVSSAREMANWLMLHLNGGCFEGRQLLHENTIRELHALQNQHIDLAQPPFDRTGETYAMGWRRATYAGHLHLSHAGQLIGFPAYVAMLPDEGLGVIVLANTAQWPHRAIAFSIFDRLLELPDRDWNAESLGRAEMVRHEAKRREQELETSRQSDSSPAASLDTYAGTYQDPATPVGRITVYVDDDTQLRLQFAGEGAYSARLEPWHDDTFRLRATAPVDNVIGPMFAKFVMNAVGCPSSVQVFGSSLLRVTET
jgi:CubicO group peptidase (beta-lactamase class C family)